MLRGLYHFLFWIFMIFVIATIHGNWDSISDSKYFSYLSPARGYVGANDEVVFKKLPRQTHFRIRINVNGKNVVTVLDTGATDLILSASDADRIGLNYKNAKTFKRYRTAAGYIMVPMIKLHEVRIKRYMLKDVYAGVNKKQNISLLGMSVMKYFHFVIDGDKLIIKGVAD